MLFVAVFLTAIVSTCCSSSLTVYQHYNENGASKTFTSAISSFNSWWNDQVSSVSANGGDWELYTDFDYEGSRMVAHDGQRLNAYHNDHYSSARPVCMYATNPAVSRLVVYEHYSSAGNSEEFNTAVNMLSNDWNDKISSVYAINGDWELYTHSDYQGSRQVIREGESKNVRSNDQVSSLRPLCETYKTTCALKSMKILNDNGQLEPKYVGNEIIGSNNGGSCSGPSGHSLMLTNADSVEESTSIEISETEEINWSISLSVEVSSEAGFLGSGTEVSFGASASAGGSHSTTTSESKSFSEGSEKVVGMYVNYDTPGAALVFGVVDRYIVDETDVPVNLILECPDGSEKVKNSTIKLNAVKFPSAHFWSAVGQFNKQACDRDWRLPDCVRQVRQDYAHVKDIDAEDIRGAFEKCFADGKGSVGK